MEIPVFGIEDQSTSPDSGLSYTINTIYDEPPLHTHTYYEFFVVTEGSALHLINDSVQTIRKGDFFFIRPSDLHSYNFITRKIFISLISGSRSRSSALSAASLTARKSCPCSPPRNSRPQSALTKDSSTAWSLS